MMLNKLGPFVVQLIPLVPDTAIFHTASLAETTEPWRYGRCLIIQYWKGKGLLLGCWTGRHPDEDSALILALDGRPDEVLDEDGHLQSRFHRDFLTSDDEWEILQLELGEPVEVLDSKDVWR